MLHSHVIGYHFPIQHAHFRPLLFDTCKLELKEKTFLVLKQAVELLLPLSHPFLYVYLKRKLTFLSAMVHTRIPFFL